MPSVGPGAGTSFWTPENIRRGLITIWYDFADPTTVALSGSDITTVRDKGAQQLIMTGGTAKPTYGLDPKTGNLVANFVGASSQYMTAAGVVWGSNPLSMFVVCQTGTGTNQYVYSGNGVGSDPALISQFASLGTEWYDGSGGPRLTAIASTTAAAWHLSSITSPGSGTMTAWGDGVVGETGTRGGAWNASAIGVALGRAHAGSNYYTGAVAEILAINADLTNDPLRVKIEQYLAAKHRLPRAAGAACSPPLVFT